MSAEPRVPNKIGDQKYPFLSNKETAIVANAGGGQTNATQLTAQINRIDTSLSSNDSVKLPKIDSNPSRLGSVGSIIFVGNSGSSSIKVFGYDQDTINGIATGTGITVAPGVNVWFVAVDYTVSTGVGTWLMTNSQAAAVAAITSGTISGVSVTNSTYTVKQVNPATATDTATITAANMLTGILVGTPTAAATYTLPLGTDMDLAATFATDESFDWSIINVATNVTYIISLSGNTGHTIIGSTGIVSNSATTGVLYGSSGRFRTRKTAANTFITYRLA